MLKVIRKEVLEAKKKKYKDIKIICVHIRILKITWIKVHFNKQTVNSNISSI